MPVSNYIGELRVEDSVDGTSIVTWSSDFDVIGDNDLKVVIEVEEFFKAALVQLKHFYG